MVQRQRGQPAQHRPARSRAGRPNRLTPIPTLRTARVEATIPVQDLDRARAFYADKLGLTPTTEGQIGIRYALADGTRFRLFKSSGSSAGAFTQMAFMADDIDALVRELKSRGVRFEEYNSPSLRTVDGVADIGYARAAWFKDSEGNLLGIGQVR
ncbi:MAG TPA: VOC family protein [Candidatus Dormibacteraeota bacterium]|nr:VOC family protein [Candidatus Dormibacteraeota bacterium]